MGVHRFRDPPNEYREVPFWSWNEAIDPVGGCAKGEILTLAKPWTITGESQWQTTPMNVWSTD